MKSEKPESLRDNASKWTRRVVASVAALSIGVASVAAFETVDELLNKHLPSFGISMQNGQASENLETVQQTKINLLCNSEVVSDVKVSASDRWKFLGLTITGASYKHLLPIWYAICDNADEEYTATTKMQHSKAVSATINMTNYKPSDFNVGINELNALLCIDAPLDASNQQVENAIAQYKRQAHNADRRIACDGGGLSTSILGATADEAVRTIETARQLAVIAGYLTPLTNEQQKQADKMAKSDIIEDYKQAIRPYAVPSKKIDVIMPKPKSPYAQISDGLGEIQPQLADIFPGSSIKFVERNHKTELTLDSKRVIGSLLIPDYLNNSQIKALNQQI